MSTPGETAYHKLLAWSQQFVTTQVISGRSKKWWDEEVAKQVKVVRHEGQKGHNRSNASNYKRVMRWKLEAAKLKKLIKKKKKECWKRFMEEYGEEDPWQIVEFAKDPWRLKVLRHLAQGTSDPPIEWGTPPSHQASAG